MNPSSVMDVSAVVGIPRNSSTVEGVDQVCILPCAKDGHANFAKSCEHAQ